MKGLKIYSLIIGLLLVFCSGSAHAQDATILGSISLGEDKEIDSLALAPNTGIAYGINSESKTLYIFDLKTYTIKKKIRLERKPNAIAVDPSNNIAYITASLLITYPYHGDGQDDSIFSKREDAKDKDSSDDRGGDNKNKGILYKADSAGNVSFIEIPKDPQGIAINDQRHEAVICIEKDKQLLILSTVTGAVTNTINLPHRPRFISLDTNSNRAVIVDGKAEGEGKQNKILIVDITNGNILSEISFEREIKSLALDIEKDIAITVSEKDVTLIDINTGRVISSFRADDAKAVDINQSTHMAVITEEDGILVLDLTTKTAKRYSICEEPEAVVLDTYKNTALIGCEDKVIEVQLQNPLPAITNLIPKSARADDPGFTLKVEGEKFITTSSVQFNQNSLMTTFKDNNELEADVPSSLLASPGTVPVTVTNPMPDGGTSEPYPFIIKAPTPVLFSIIPNTIAARSPEFILKVYGTNFTSGNVVNFNGQDLQTTFINPGELNAIVPSSLIQIRGIYLVVVITPDGQNSNYLNFTVTDPFPRITDFTPKQGLAGTAVTITGDNFNYVPVTVSFNGAQAIIQSITQTEIKAVVPMGASTGPITVTTSIGNAQSAEPFTVLLRQDFALNVTPQSVSIPSGGNASIVVSLQSTGIEEFTGLVKLSINNIPSGITPTFNPEYISINKSSILNIKLTSALADQTALNINGTANMEGIDITRTALLTVNPTPPGATTITGRIMRSKDAMPIKGVTLTIGDKTAITDDAGNFFFIDIPVGELTLKIDGHTANTDTISYPSDIVVPVTIIGGVDNKLPYFIYLHEVNTKNFTPIDVTKDTIVKDPEIPDFEMKIPLGVQIIGHDGLPNEKISVTLVPPDRLAIRPPPDGVYAGEIYMYYFFKPGGGTPTQPIPVKMPNTFQALPGDRVELWYYDESLTPDPNSNQWKTFGMGTVSDDGKNIIPDPGVGIPKFCCGASFPRPSPDNPGPPGGKGPSPGGGGGGCKIGGKSIDPYNGMFVHTDNDISYPAPSMINMARLYKSDNTTIGQFGAGTSTGYDHFLQGSGNALTYITPEAGRYILSKNADGSYTNTQYPFLKNAKAYLNSDNTRTLKFKDGSSYAFDSNGRLIEQRDNNANWVQIARDSLGNITGISDSYGRKLYITNTTIQIGLTIYTVISSIKDAIGRTITYTYDTSARLTSVTMPDGTKTSYTYDGNSRLSSVTNPRGIVELSLTYDSQGRVSKQVNADGGEYLFYYFGSATPVRVVDPPAPVTASCTPQFVREGDSATSNTCGIIYANVPTSTVVPQGSTATATIIQTVAIYPNKSSKTHRFNSQGYLLSMTDGAGGQTSNDLRISTNELLTATDKLGRKTSNTYDSNGNTTSITDPAGNITYYEYDPVFNKPTKITDALGNVMTMSYDAKGKLISTTDPAGNTTTISYNANGKPVSVTDALGNSSTMEYDSYGNLIKTTDPLGNSAQMQYDLIGRLLKSTDPKGKSTSYVYDMMNRIKEVADALNGITKYTYDPNGNLLTVTDAKGQKITYTYNVRDKVATMIDQVGKIETYSYDKMDNLIAGKDRKGQTTNYTYDIDNKITKTTYADDSYINYQYDALARLNYVYDSISGPIQYLYSNNGCNLGCGSSIADKVIQEITSLGSISYTYDVLGRRASMTVAGQPTVNYAYDANRRLTNILTSVIASPEGAWQSLSFGFAYDALGRRTSLTRPNGVTTNYSYDSASNLLDIDHLNPLNAILEKISYVYDSNGNRKSKDRLNVQPKLPNPTSNITYNSANQMLTFNDKNITYDADGNMVSITNTCGTTIYTWDARNRLAGISGFNTDCSVLSASFKYDALGRRIEKTINGKSIQYLYDGMDIIQEIENGTVTANYIRTLNIDEPLLRITSNALRFYQQDALGSVIALTDETGAIKTTYTYDPFGNVTITGEATDNPFQFAGRENDGTGLLYERARYDSLELNRYISQDPLRFAGGDVNWYVRVANNPVRYTDPMGLAIWICNRKVRNWFIGGVISGNHAYLWDDTTGTCCGRGSTTSCTEKGPYGKDRDNCTKVEDSAGKENQIMQCCKNTGDSGAWRPPVNDCHTTAGDCIEWNGLKNPSAPGGRIGKPCDPCK